MGRAAQGRPPRVLFLFPTLTYRAEAFVSAAARMGLAATVATEEAGSLQSLRPRDLLQLDPADPREAAAAAARFAARVPVDAVVGVDEPTAAAAAAVAEALSLTGNPPAAAAAAANKHTMRLRMRRAGVPGPRFRCLSVQDDAAAAAPAIRYPCVLKPTILSGSRGVIRADNAAEFAAAFSRVRAVLARPDVARRGAAARQILVEDFLPGREVALEGLLCRGSLRTLALFDKPDPLDGPFFEETLYLTPSRLPRVQQRRAAECAARAARALGLREGPVHAEMRIHRGRPRLVEIAARSIGGRCARVLRFRDGGSLEELILRHALGMDCRRAAARERAAAGVLMIPVPQAGTLVEVRGISEARAVAGVEEVDITTHRGQRLEPLPEESRYMGFVFARAGTPAAVEGALRRARELLVFVLQPPARGADPMARGRRRG